MEILGLELWQVLLVLLAGFWAGTINSVVGSGTLVTFPVLVSVGFPPVTAQMSNAIGLVAAGFSGTWGYRRELYQAKAVVPVLTTASLLGGLIGSGLLMVLPEAVFSFVAPILIVFAIIFVILQPKMSAWVKARKAGQQQDDAPPAGSESIVPVPTGPVSPLLWVLVFLIGIYGGYFVAAQGVLLIGVLGVFLNGLLVHANAVKTWLSTVVNVVAALGYIIFAFDRINWTAVLLIAVSSLIGGSVGAQIGRRISPLVLRIVIVIVAVAGLINLVFDPFGTGA
ncbi:sulfite exporter TauE/SafE family protein [Auritidibacter ignavus]|uniref:Probable membrane transporter protein n=2 Tax=Auritidibacter ignavus TaxID=678932 RepID=A0AAJ6APF8_9MICC|nr:MULTISPECIES: sulfite exporter TauE/SafE family protein [Auritidibacter]AXR73516.1 sulfite exporter TauE/SafE family protein [Auritidibacter sp. NML130574]WGH93685.1 sulfite exporter TauE/SafE family protein [Auritidibacter ignavus]